MNHQVKGKAQNLKGRAKQAVGAMTGNKELEAKGAVERAKGAVEELAGKAQRKLQHAADKARDKMDEDEDKGFARGRGNA